MARKKTNSESGMTLRAAKTSCKVHRSFVKNGETHNIEEFIVGTPEFVKEATQANNNGERVQVEHVHTTKVYDKEVHEATNNGIVKRRTEVVKQSYDFGDGEEISEPEAKVETKTTSATSAPEEPVNTAPKSDDPLNKGERFLKNMIKSTNAWLILVAGLAILAFGIAIVALFI